MLDVKKLLAKVLGSLPLFVEVNMSGTMPALGANSYFNISLTGNIPSGYKPVAVKSFSTGTSNYYIHAVTTSNNGVYIAGRSHNGQTTTASASAVVLCMKIVGGVFNLQTLRNILTPRKVVWVC